MQLEGHQQYTPVAVLPVVLVVVVANMTVLDAPHHAFLPVSPVLMVLVAVPLP